MKQRKLIPTDNQFDLRSEISYSSHIESVCPSIGSQDIFTNEISDEIEALILEEKKKYMPSKTENKMTKNLTIVKAKRFQTVANFMQKPIHRLPHHIGRMLNSTKTYPNVPSLGRKQDELDHIYGAFFGFFIGDVIGSHMAYAARDFQFFIPNALLMNGGGTYNLGPGQGTDQTEIFLSLCHGIIEGKGTYQPNSIATKYMQWFESKPFNFSAVFALSMKQLRKMKVDKVKINPQTIGKTLRESSLKNKNHESSIGLIRILPLTIFSLKFSESDSEKLIKHELQLICPNELVIESGLVYAKILRLIFLTRDHERAFYEASKWVHNQGSSRLIELWEIIQKGAIIPSKGNMGKLKTSFTYSCIQINKKQINFVESLTAILSRGGDTQTNCAVVLALVGAVVGYNGIPGYFKQKIINSRMKDSPRPRDQKYAPNNVIEIIEGLLKYQSGKLVIIQ